MSGKAFSNASVSSDSLDSAARGRYGRRCWSAENNVDIDGGWKDRRGYASAGQGASRLHDPSGTLRDSTPAFLFECKRTLAREPDKVVWG